MLTSSNNSKTSMQTHSSLQASTAASVSTRGPLSDDDSGLPEDEPAYAWTPPGLNAKALRQYFSGFPEHLIPYIDTPGDRYRCCQLLKQLPPQDNEARYCSNLTEDEQRELEDFARQRKEHALGRGTVRQIPKGCQTAICRWCNGNIQDFAVFASRSGEQEMWHPQCFRCQACEEILVDLIYFFDSGNLYCGRHHAEKLKPRCSNCDEIIFCEECTEAEHLFWHTHHFVCNTCSCALGGSRYIMREKKPYCTTCFETDYGQKCFTCEETIALDQGTVSYQGQIWHAQPNCFNCKNCETPLLNRAFLPKFGLVFCSHDCSNRYEQTASQILHQSVTPTGTQLQLAGLPDANATSNATSRAYTSSSNIKQRNVPLLPHDRGKAPPATNPFKRPTAASVHKQRCSSHDNGTAPQQHIYEKLPRAPSGNVASLAKKFQDHSPFRPISPQQASSHHNLSSSFPGQTAHFQQGSSASSSQGKEAPLPIAVTTGVKPMFSTTNSTTYLNGSTKAPPPVPPKRTNSQLSNDHSGSNHLQRTPLSGSASQLTVQPLPIHLQAGAPASSMPSQTSLTNQSGISQGTMNKSVNFHQNVIHSESSSLREETGSLQGITATSSSLGQTQPKSILKKTQNTSMHASASSTQDKFPRGTSTTQSLRRPKSQYSNWHSDNANSEPEFNVPFTQKSRRARSIEQDLNKPWKNKKSSSGATSRHNRSLNQSLSRVGTGAGYYSDADAYNSSSSSTLGDDDEEEDYIGDWEHQAIALANSKIINPTSNKSRAPMPLGASQSLDRRRSAKSAPPRNTQPGLHQTYMSDSSGDLSRKQKNLAQFDKVVKKLEKKRAKSEAKSKKKRHGKNCVQQ